MWKDRRAAEYMVKVEKRLRDGGFTITDDTSFGDSVFHVVARKRGFDIMMEVAETFFVFAEIGTTDPGALAQFSATAFDYAVKTRDRRLAQFSQGSRHVIVCYPVAVVDGIDPIIGEALRNATPPFRWFNHEMLAVHDLRGNGLHYSQKTPKWAQISTPWLYGKFRNTIDKMLRS